MIAAMTSKLSVSGCRATATIQPSRRASSSARNRGKIRIATPSWQRPAGGRPLAVNESDRGCGLGLKGCREPFDVVIGEADRLRRADQRIEIGWVGRVIPG